MVDVIPFLLGISKDSIIEWGLVRIVARYNTHSIIKFPLTSSNRRFIDYNWKQTAEIVNRIKPDELYEAERFQTSVQDDIKVLGENIANALNEAINIIDKWFRECIDGLQKDG
jgi:hypothetical protein